MPEENAKFRENFSVFSTFIIEFLFNKTLAGVTI
jgi:hypothetical protein